MIKVETTRHTVQRGIGGESNSVVFFLDPFQEDVNVSPMVKRILSLVGIEKGRIRTNAVIDSTVVIVLKQHGIPFKEALGVKVTV